MTNHALLSPSSFNRLQYCRAAPTAEHDYPSDDHPSAIEGRAAHLVAQLYATANVLMNAGETVADEGNLTEVTAEMREGAIMVASDIAQELGASWRQRIVCEETVSLAGLHPESWGTLDYRAQFPGYLYFWDYKFGHRYVDAFENWQMIAYSYPFVSALSPEEEMTTTVQFTIVQPRNYHQDGPVRRWVVKAHELRAYYNILAQWMHEALAQPVMANPVPAACQDCSARHVCSALRGAAYVAMDLAKEAAQYGLQPDQLGVELSRVQDMATLLKAYQTGLEEEADGTIRRGVQVPNFTLGSTSNPLQWAVPDEDILALGDACGVDLRKPREILTPTQASKLLPAGVIDQYAKRIGRALKLTRANHTLAKKVFK